jgi:hypothetical protein
MLTFKSYCFTIALGIVETLVSPSGYKIKFEDNCGLQERGEEKTGVGKCRRRGGGHIYSAMTISVASVLTGPA